LLKGLAYLLLLAVLAALVWQWPMLWELAIAGAIGGVYWIFFRIPPAENADAD
jgi:hypothetical protein